MKILAMLLIPLLMVPAFAESQTVTTDNGSLDVKLTYDTIKPDTQETVNIDFINPTTGKIQEHIDYKLVMTTPTSEKLVLTSSCSVTGLCHTSSGTVGIPVEFDLEGLYKLDFEVEGILFQPIPPEAAAFEIAVGESVDVMPPESGGCLIATATYGSELAPQVQQLRELRDNIILPTESGKSFMTLFNQVYYSFSPAIADYERENPAFKEIIKVGITPMLSSLSLLNYVEIDSEEKMMGYGISVILLNIGMYAGIPIFGILKLYQFRK